MIYILLTVSMKWVLKAKYSFITHKELSNIVMHVHSLIYLAQYGGKTRKKAIRVFPSALKRQTHMILTV
jgi:hypothetical protein